jgi:hypothetical protein
MNFTNQHLVIGDSNSIFISLYIDVLVNRCHIKQDKIVFVTLDSELNNTLPKNIDIKFITYTDCPTESLATADSITLMSFHKGNSFVVKNLYALNQDLLSKVHIYLTDDEVARWRKIKKKKGRIVPDNKLIGSNDVEMLPYLKSFITSERAFRKPLNEVLGRNNFRIIDVRDPFSTMPVAQTDKFNEILEMDSVHDQPEKKILIGSKRGSFSFREVRQLLNSLNKQSLLEEYKFIFFTEKRRLRVRILTDLYCQYLRHIKKVLVDVSCPMVTNSLTYTSLIMSCSHFILQGRGGMSSVRGYISNGRGVVCVQKNTPNHFELTHGLELEVISYTSFDNLAQQIDSSDVDIQHNMRKMTATLDRYYQELKNLYL